MFAQVHIMAYGVCTFLLFECILLQLDALKCLIMYVALGSQRNVVTFHHILYPLFMVEMTKKIGKLIHGVLLYSNIIVKVKVVKDNIVPFRYSQAQFKIHVTNRLVCIT